MKKTLTSQQKTTIILISIIVGVMIIGLIVALVAVSSNSRAGTYENSDYVYTVANGKATLTKSKQEISDLVIPDKIGGVDVVGIGKEIFKGSNLRTISFGKNVRVVEEGAFDDCQKLQTLRMDKNEYDITFAKNAFRNCINLKAITLGSGITALGDGMFEKCTALEEVSLPLELKAIGDNAFSECTRLKVVNFPSKLEKLGNKAFYRTVLRGTENVNNDTERGDIRLPKNLQSIGDYAFGEVSGFEKLIFNEELTSIGEGAFYNVYSLRDLVLPSKLKTISKRAFARCTSITNKIVIPASVEYIGGGAFGGLSSLAEIDTANNTKYKFNKEGNMLIEGDRLISVTYVKTNKQDGMDTFSIPAEIKKIDDYACGTNYYVRKIVVEGAVEIGAYAFADMVPANNEVMYFQFLNKDCEIGRGAFNLRDVDENDNPMLVLIAPSGGSVERWVVANGKRVGFEPR